MPSCSESWVHTLWFGCVAVTRGAALATWFFLLLYSEPWLLKPSAAFAFSVAQFDAGRRPSCEPSDDPAYTCFLPRPPGAFDNEFSIYFSVKDEQLLVKIVAPKIAGSGIGRRKGAWVSVGFSPDGRMAGPSEAVIGAWHIHGEGEGEGERSVAMAGGRVWDVISSRVGGRQLYARNQDVGNNRLSKV